MSWISSWFSAPRTPAASTTADPHERRLLDEPAASSEPITPAQPQQSVAVPQPVTSTSQSAQAENKNRNKVVFGAGVAFFALSLLITRRSFARRRLASNPAFYTNAPGHHAEQALKVSAPMEAAEALNIATINVLSLAMMGTGGAMWYLDINSMADARRLLRGGLGVDGTGKDEQEAEEEFEEWTARVLARSDARSQSSAKTNERGQQR